MSHQEAADDLIGASAQELSGSTDPISEAIARFEQDMQNMTTLEVVLIDDEPGMIGRVTLRHIESNSIRVITEDDVDKERQRILSGEAPNTSIFTFLPVSIDIGSDQLDKEAKARAQHRAITEFAIKAVNKLSTSNKKRKGSSELKEATRGISDDFVWLAQSINAHIYEISEFEVTKDKPIKSVEDYFHNHFDKITSLANFFATKEADRVSFPVEPVINAVNAMMGKGRAVDVKAVSGKQPSEIDLTTYPSWVTRFFKVMMPRIADADMPATKQDLIEMIISYERENLDQRLARALKMCKTDEDRLLLADYALVSYGAYLGFSISRTAYGRILGALFAEYIHGDVQPYDPPAMIKLVDAMTGPDERDRLSQEAKVIRVPGLFRRIDRHAEIDNIKTHNLGLQGLSYAVDTILLHTIEDKPVRNNHLETNGLPLI